MRHSDRSELNAGTADAATGALPVDVVGCDLFAGAGGFSLGALEAKIRVAAAVEFNRYAAASYRNNLVKSARSQTLLYEDDIEQLDPAVVRSAAGFEQSGCDILMGGPPCQGFSAHRINDAGVGDPRNALLLRYFEFVRVLRPMFFLVENVPGLLWPRHKSFLDAFYQLADAADYEVMKPVVLNAKDFGVPQSRRRVFILGMDRRRQAAMPAWPPPATHVAQASPDMIRAQFGLALQLHSSVPYRPTIATTYTCNMARSCSKPSRRRRQTVARERIPVASSTATAIMTATKMYTGESIRHGLRRL